MKRKLRSRAYQRRRAHKQARACRSHSHRLAARRRRLIPAAPATTPMVSRRREPNYDFIVRAPAVLSFVQQPSEFIGFLSRLRAVCQPNRRVLINMRPVEELSNCALLLLQAKLQDGLSFTRGAEIYVNPPEDAGAARVWFTAFPSSQRGRVDQPQYQNRILGRRRHFHKQVEVQLAEFLVHEAMRYLSGTTQDNHAAYRTLIECMSNTFKHADPQTEATENWWVASYAHPGPGPKRWCFAFVDNGVGILKSLEIKGFFKRLRQILGLLPNHETLQMLMQGKIGSRLGLSYRGKGLPGIYKELQRGRIHNLVIIANDTLANFATQDYVTLTQPFTGTFLYWELSLPPQSLTP